MPSYDYDLFTIGAGSGGVRASRLAAISGAKVAVAEEYRPGGTCVIRGCVPKKFMVYASGFRKQFQLAGEYGWSFGEPEFDWPSFRDCMNDEVDRLSGIYAKNLNNAGCELIEDRAEFVDAHTLRLVNAKKTVTAKNILIAVGGWPIKPDTIKGVEHACTSNELFHLKKLPQHMVIVGGGYIAVEFAQVFAGLGVEVCLVYRGETVLRGFDEDVRVAVHEGLKRSGVRVVTHCQVSKIDKPGKDGFTTVHLENGETIDKVDQVCLATGRAPKTQGLGLDKAGVKTDERGAVIVNEYSQTSAKHIHAVGDVTDRINLTPVAIREAMCFVETVFHDNPTAYDYENVASAVFTQPPAGTVGLSEGEARQKYGQIDVYKSTFRPMKGMLGDNPDRMLVKLVVKADDERVVGVHLVGDDAPEIIQAIAIAVKAGLTKRQFDATCAVHPTVAEELVTMREKWTPPEMK